MNYLLSNHERAYNLSLNDGLLSVCTIFSGAPYAARHWDLSNRSPQHCLGHRVIAILQAIPVLGLLFSLIERIAAWFLVAQPLEQPIPLPALQPLPLIGLRKVALRNASQYNMPGERPAACTFHAVSAIKEISTNFVQIFNWAAQRDSERLSAFQRDVILNKGLPLYERSIAQNPQLVEGADFEQIRPYLPEGVQLQLPAVREDHQPFENNLHEMARHLFAPLPLTKMGWIKTGNEESFAIVVRGDRAIIFDSHYNEIIATGDQRSTLNALREKLLPSSNEIRGLDVSPFAYALNT